MPGTRRTRHSRIFAAMIALLLLLATTSCGHMDDIMDEAKDVIDEAGDVVDAIRDNDQDSPSDEGQSGVVPTSGGRTTPLPPRPTGTISTGSAAPLASGAVGPNGGSIAVQKPGDPLDGLEIQVPPGSYPDSRPFEVSSAPVDGHTFGEYFTPATPLISIENGGDYSEEFMTVTIPAEVPPDHFAMAFYYDGATGTLEGIPFNAIDEHSITIVTRHFCDIIVSIISNTVLDDLMKSDIDSGFRPGADDWQFTNYGSYIATGGHCAGQCLSALWYFCERPDGTDPFLWGLYDNNGDNPATPALWEDDSYGYRLASTVQEDINWNSFENDLMAQLAGKDDDLTLKAFAYAIQLTGEPQEVGIFSNAGGGHDMICYRVHNNRLYIADPNYPGNTERRIEFSSGKFNPYNSGANAAEIAAGNGKAYETIEYCAKSATVDWNTIATRWSEFKAGTIGNDRFPQYQVVIKHDDGKEEALVDGYESEYKRVKIAVNGHVPIGIKVFRNGKKLDWDNSGKYELEDGNNEIGIAIYGDVNNNPQNRDYEYIDFQYFNIQYGEEECYGWVLDEIVQKEFNVIPSDANRLDLQFDASSDGWYTSSGTHQVSTTEDDILVDFAHSGTWTGIPECVEPNETIRIEVTASSSVNASQPNDWGIMGTTIWASWDGRYSAHINQEMYANYPPSESTDFVEFQFYEGSPGAYLAPIIIECSSDSGWATYEYHYVWQE